MTTLKFSNTTDHNSAPFIDYTDDAIYVGDDAGALHKLAVFSWGLLGGLEFDR